MNVSEYAAMRAVSPDEAYKALFDEYCDYVYAVVWSKLGGTASREDIEECVSDVFAEIWFSFESGPPAADMKGFIGTVAKRRAINRYHSISARAAKTAADNEDMLGSMSDGSDIEAESDKAELRRILLDCIDGLGEPDRTLIIQKFYYRRTSPQIAKMLSMKPSAVRMRIKRAVAKLGELLGQRGITG